MKKIAMITALALGVFGVQFCRAQSDPGMPKLVKQDGVTQLYVDQKPFLMLSGELNNSSSSSMEIHEADMETGYGLKL